MAAKRRLIHNRRRRLLGLLPGSIHVAGTPRKNILPIRRKVMRGRAQHTWSKKCAFCQCVIVYSGIPSASTRSPPFIVPCNLAKPCPCTVRKPGLPCPKQKTSSKPGGFENTTTTHGQPVGTSWLRFGTAYRRGHAPSHFERGLNPARPGLSLGVFRRFGTMACLSRRRLA
jgi:hypothetical protein